LSPSGEGAKLWLVGTLPDGVKHRVPCGSGEIEAYDRGRYFTMTGQRLPDVPSGIEDRQEALARLCDRLLRSQAQPEPTLPLNGKANGAHRDYGPRSDEDVITAGERFSPKFAALWCGDTSSYDGDDSRADLALCDLLAWLTGNDPAAMDRLFRRSGLMREKWDSRRGGQTYGQLTISKAITGSTKTFDWSRDYSAPTNG